MDEIAYLIGDSDCFEVGFLEREATPESAMKLGIRLHLTGLSLSVTKQLLGVMGVNRWSPETILISEYCYWGMITITDNFDHIIIFIFDLSFN